MKYGSDEYKIAEKKEIHDVLHRLDVYDIRWVNARTTDARLRNYMDAGLIVPSRETWLCLAVERRFQLQHGHDRFAGVDE